MAVGLMLLIVATLTYGLTAAPVGPRTLRQFNPDRMADLELRMWQAYYAKERVRLFALLVTMLHEQNHYSWVTATREGFHLARAAATFGDAPANYEIVLPDLESGYGIAKDWLHAGFDPRAVVPKRSDRIGERSASYCGSRTVIFVSHWPTVELIDVRLCRQTLVASSPASARAAVKL